MTAARYGGRLSALRTGRLYPQEYSWYSFSLRVESTPGPWFGRKEICHWKNPVTTLGIDPGTVRLVAQCLNHYATPGPEMAGVALQNKLHSGLRASQRSLTTATGLMNWRVATLTEHWWITLRSVQCNGNHWRDKIFHVCACLVARMLTDAYREMRSAIITDCNIQVFNHGFVSPTFTRTFSIITSIQNKH